MKGEVWIPINFNLDFAPKEWQDIMSIEFSTAWNSRVTLEEIVRINEKGE
jgi:hypothetical protein